MSNYLLKYNKYKNMYNDIKLKINQTGGNNQDRMTISSDFKENTRIPEKYTCEGEGFFPEIFVNDIPKETKSLAIIVEDPDAPKGLWTHLVAWNIPKENDKISFFELKKGNIGQNTTGKNVWTAPCPPAGDSPHRYFFKVFALDTLLNLPPNTNADTLKRSMKENILAQSELVGIFDIES